jgi:hypothetical protein
VGAQEAEKDGSSCDGRGRSGNIEAKTGLQMENRIMITEKNKNHKRRNKQYSGCSKTFSHHAKMKQKQR